MPIPPSYPPCNIDDLSTASEYWKDIVNDHRNVWLADQFLDPLMPFPNFIGTMYVFEMIDKNDFESFCKEALDYYYIYRRFNFVLNEIHILYLLKNYVFLKPESILYNYFN